MGKASSRPMPRNVGSSIRKRDRVNKNDREAKKLKIDSTIIDLTQISNVDESEIKIDCPSASSHPEVLNITEDVPITSTPKIDIPKNLDNIENKQPTVKFFEKTLEKSFGKLKEEIEDPSVPEIILDEVSAGNKNEDCLIYPDCEFDEDFDSDHDLTFLCDVTFDDSSLDLKPVEDPSDQPATFPCGSRPYDFFKFFLDDVIINTIVSETNAYAESLLAKESIIEWKPIDKNELLVYIALILHSGTMKNLDMKDYWGELDIFAKTMSRNRFIEITKCLHFAQNDPKDDPFYKITPLIDHFNNKCSAIFKMFPSDLICEGFMFYCQNELKYYSGINLTMIIKPKTNMVINFNIHGLTSIKNGHDPSIGHFMDDALKRCPEKDIEHNITHFSFQWTPKNDPTYNIAKMSFYYPCSMKVKWYKTIAFHVFHTMMYNSYHFYCMKYKMKYNDFRKNVIDTLLKLPYSNRPKNIGKCHFPRKNIKKLCLNCKENHMKDKYTMFDCKGCEKTPLCIDCFQEYHELLFRKF